ncbi:hypothetical protein CRE_24494 [Caenorhabditis remanei]|uniref:Domain of unknown function WSN domain-containing protein n=1 Tax=Caenorhabditis remanei TaxID=31234 RepID=E3MFX4_CAERE|nr:hypothetical protein CRE_24494 [Caenorhabditis remanei]
MKSALFLFLFLTVHSHAESTPSTPLLNIEKELANISTSCLSRRDHEEITGNTLRYGMAVTLNANLISEAQFLIGAIELRKALGLPPHGPWKRARHLKEEEILAAPTIEEYYERREESLSSLNLDSSLFLEENFPPAIAFLDKRFPAIREIYRQEFRNAKKAVDRAEVDSMVSKYRDVGTRIDKAVEKMRRKSYLCWRENKEELENTVTPSTEKDQIVNLTVPAFKKTSEIADNTIDDVSFLLNETLQSSSPLDLDKEIRAIAYANLTTEDHTRFSDRKDLRPAQELIGLTELRSALGLEPPGSNYSRTTNDGNDTSIEDYYELKEPKVGIRVDKNATMAASFLDMRFPAIRTIYNQKFQGILERPEANGTISREDVDLLTSEYYVIAKRLDRALNKLELRDIIAEDPDIPFIVKFFASVADGLSNIIDY